MFVGGKVLGVGAEFIMDVVEARENAKGEVDFPNRDIIKRRAGTAGYRRHPITERLIDQSIEVKHVNCPDDEEENEEGNKYFMMPDQLHKCHISIIRTPPGVVSTPPQFIGESECL